jgi:hypothetical protein
MDLEIRFISCRPLFCIAVVSLTAFYLTALPSEDEPLLEFITSFLKGSAVILFLFVSHC